MANRDRRRYEEKIPQSSVRILVLSSLLMAIMGVSLHSPEQVNRTRDYDAKTLIEKYERAVRENDASSINRNRYRMENLLKDNSLPLSDNYRKRIEQIRNETTKR